MSKFIENFSSNDLNIFNDENIFQTYFYWADKLELQKLLTENENNEYIPCFPYDEIDFTEICGKNILIFFKQPKILYGSSNIKSIIINSKKAENLNINNSQLYYELNDKLYSKLVSKYNVVSSYHLFFIKLNKIKVFEYKIDINSFNKFKYDCEKSETANANFKYPFKISPTQIVKSYSDENFGKKMISYINYLSDLAKTMRSDEENTNESSEEKSNKNHEIIFKIPILWIKCDDFSDVITQFDNGCIDKKKFKHELIYHWNKCEKCEKNNNNMGIVDMDNKKITIKKINGKKCHNFFESIVDSYQNLTNYEWNPNTIEHSNDLDINLDSNKINIIYSNTNELSQSIYSKCLFLLDK